MRTDDQAFHRQFNELKRRIAMLPAEQRADLEALAAETLARREQTRDAVARAHQAADKLEVLLRLAVFQRFSEHS
jgi:hypothetical protein